MGSNTPLNLPIKFYLNEQEIEQVETFKYLGFEVKNKLIIEKNVLWRG